ncbi:MAG: hypothetical protein P9M14_01405 [Candidatus Alcyoniella australis]|nr:hypothetical protein [Candidatus Alcyoniella australis]
MLRLTILVAACAAVLLALAGWTPELTDAGDVLRLSLKATDGADSRQGPTAVVAELVNTSGEELRLTGNAYFELTGGEEFEIFRADIDLRTDNAQTAAQYQLLIEPAAFVRSSYVLQQLQWTSPYTPRRKAQRLAQAVPPGKYKLRLVYNISSLNGPAFASTLVSNKVKLDYR